MGTITDLVERGSRLHDAVAHYDELLAKTHLGSTVEAIGAVVDSQSQTGVARQVCSVLRPRFITESQNLLVNTAAMAVFQALKCLQARMLDDESMAAALPADPAFLRLIRNSLTRPSGVMGRLDAFIGDRGRVSFMEFNPNPGGVFYFDMTAAAFLAAPVMKEFQRRFPVEQFKLSGRIAPALSASYARHGGSGLPCVAMVFDPAGAGAIEAVPGQPASLNFEQSLEGQRLLAMLTKNQVPHVIAGIDDFRYSPNAGLTAQGKKIDAVFVENWRPLLEKDALHPLLAAARARAVWLMNSAADKVMLGNKGAFALLSDPAFNAFLPADLRVAVDAFIPWTRLFKPSTTPFHGKTVDLVSMVADSKDRFVLKPADGWGGAQVTLGIDSSEAQWQDAVRHALDQPFVVQERIEVTPESYPIVENGVLAFRDHFVDLNPYIWSETAAYGMGARAARSALTNFKQGASLLPVLVLK